MREHTRRDLVSAAVAIASGLGIARLDSGPRWDDTGITVALLVSAAAIAAVISGRRPWLWALIVGLPTPIVETTTGGSAAAFASIAFAAAGAAIGYAMARSLQPRGIPRSPGP